MFFWESTHIGSVTYPAWLDRIYGQNIFKNILRLMISFLTLAAFIHLGLKIIQRRISNSPLHLIFFLSFLTIGFYSLFTILTRFSFPIVSLFMMMIAYLLQSLLAGKIKKN